MFSRLGIKRKSQRNCSIVAACEALETRQLLSTVYVDLNAPGPIQNGQTWATAFKNLTTSFPSGTVIDVAQGTYYPTTGSGRSATFQLTNGVQIDGGFAGAINSTATRNIPAYPTILSGDVGAKGNSSDNAYHVVTGSGTNATAILDGVTVTGGNANLSGNQGYDGAGIYDVSGSPTIRNCTITGNASGGYSGSGDGGGGMYNYNSSPIVTNCVFSNNSATLEGGGMSNYENSDAVITDCQFIENSGGGMSNEVNQTGSTTVIDCAFDANSGGAMFNDIQAVVNVTNCTFVGNSSTIGGAISGRSAGGGGSVITNCTFVDNSASNGGAVGNADGGSFSISLINCILWNDSSNVGEFYDVVSPGSNQTFPVSYSDISGGYAGTGNINADPLFVRNPSPGPDGIWGTADDDYGNLQLQPGSPVVDAGSNAAVPSGVTTDIGGNNRFQDVPTSAHTGAGTVPIVDMGAYEATAALNADPGGPYVAVAGQILTLHSTGASNVAGPLQYNWDFSGSGLFTDATGANPTFSTAGYAAGTLVTVALQVTDAGSNSVVSDATIFIEAPTLYVDASAAGANNGTSWANAYTNLQTALATAQAIESNSPAVPINIDVAEGTYYPTRSLLRVATFNLVNNVELDGGFAGASNPSATRNIAAYPTILSGDIGVKGVASDNSFSVVTGFDVNATAVVDGFTITGGSGGTYSASFGGQGGAGIYDNAGSPTIRNCIIGGNTGVVICTGVGMFNYNSSSPTVYNCSFIGNSCPYANGGGMANFSNSSPTLTNCNFSGNSSGTGPGGAIDDLFNSSPTMTDCTFIGNSAGEGGGISNSNSSPSLTNCLFAGNKVTTSGGGVYNYSSSPVLTNCTFTGNSATTSGGGIYDGDSASLPVLANSILWADSSVSSAEIYAAVAPLATYCDIDGGFAGIGNLNADPLFVNAAAGNLALQPGSPCINAGSNAAVPAGITTDLAGNPRITFGVVDIGAYEYQGVTFTGNGDGHSFSDPNNWSSGAVPGALDIISIPAGADVQVAANNATLTLGGVFISSGGLLDLANNSLAINFTGADPVSALRGYLQSAYNGGSWNGATGLTSSVVQGQVAAAKESNGGVYELGYADGDLDGSVGEASANQIIISPQLAADANEDGQVNFSDLVTVAQNFGSTTGDWVHGDFNYDAIVNFQDLVLLAQNFGKTNGNTLLGEELAVKVVAVVEPVFSSSLIISAATLDDGDLLGNAGRSLLK